MRKVRKAEQLKMRACDDGNKFKMKQLLALKMGVEAHDLRNVGSL